MEMTKLIFNGTPLKVILALLGGFFELNLSARLFSIRKLFSINDKLPKLTLSCSTWCIPSVWIGIQFRSDQSLSSFLAATLIT